MTTPDLLAHAELVRRMREGDPWAFEHLFEPHEEALRARIAQILPASLRRRESVSDALQETRITALARCASFEERHENALRAWLLRIAELKALATVRRHSAVKRAASREASGSGLVDEIAGRDSASPSQAVMRAELGALVRTALETLPDDYREVLRLARIEGLPLGEVALRMGRSREAIKKLYGRAVSRFAVVFRGMTDDTPHG